MKKVYDIAIIGGGFSGLLVALQMQKKGYSTCLIEQTSKVGGHLQVSNDAFQIQRRFPLFLNTEETRSSLTFLSEVLNEDISYKVKQVEPLIFEKRGTSQVSGQNLPSVLQKFTSYTQNNRIFLDHPSHNWLSKMLELYSGDILTDHKVTVLKREDKKIVYCLCNDNQEIFAERFIFCASFHTLKSLLKDDPALLSHQRSIKTQPWTAISIDFVHSIQITDTPALHILLAKHKEDIYPFFGVFHLLQEKGQISQWLTFLDHTTDKDEEKHTEWVIRNIKKQLENIYPRSIECLSFERLFISQHYEHKNIKVTKNKTLLGAEDNFYVPIVSKSQYRQNWIDSISTVKSFLDVSF